MGHVVVAAAKFLLERGAHSHRLDAGDHHAGVHNHFAHSVTDAAILREFS